MINYLYYRFFHRNLMKFVHRYGWHHMRTIRPGNDILLRCDWCETTAVVKRGSSEHIPSINGPDQVDTSKTDH
jgi:hypothetical protein